MTTERFVCSTLGIDGHVIDELCEDFDVDITDEDVFQAIKDGVSHTWGVGMELLVIVLWKIMELYPELEGEKFDYDVSSPSYPVFTYDGHEFHTKRQLDDIAGREEDSQLKTERLWHDLIATKTILAEHRAVARVTTF